MHDIVVWADISVCPIAPLSLCVFLTAWTISGPAQHTHTKL